MAEAVKLGTGPKSAKKGSDSVNYESRKQRGEWDRTMFMSLLLMTTGGIALVTLLVLIGIWRTGSRFFHGLEVLFNPPQPTSGVNVHSIVVRQVRNASELMTTVFAMQAVVPTSQGRAIVRGVEPW